MAAATWEAAQWQREKGELLCDHNTMHQSTPRKVRRGRVDIGGLKGRRRERRGTTNPHVDDSIAQNIDPILCRIIALKPVAVQNLRLLYDSALARLTGPWLTA